MFRIRDLKSKAAPCSRQLHTARRLGIVGWLDDISRVKYHVRFREVDHAFFSDGRYEEEK